MEQLDPFDAEMLADCLLGMPDSDLLIDVPEIANVDPIPIVRPGPAPRPPRVASAGTPNVSRVKATVATPVKMKKQDEIDYLRDRQKELKRKLVVLKEAQAAKRAAVSSPWDEKARVQSLKRQKAEQENLTLKKSLEYQVNFGKELEAVLEAVKCPVSGEQQLRD